MRLRLRPAAALLLSLLALPAALHAQPGTPDAGPPTLVRAGRMFDSEKAAFTGPRDILIRGGRIEQVGENLAVPEGARVIDLRDKTVLPGLIDAHTHLLLLVNTRVDETEEMVHAVSVEGTTLRALRGAARARTWLEAGFTSVRDLGNSGAYGDVALATAIREGALPGPRVYPSGPGISSYAGQFRGLEPGHQGVAEEEYLIVRTPDEAADAVRRNVTMGARVIKIFSENTPNRGTLSVEEMRAIVESAKRHGGVTVAAHATSDAGVWRAVEAGVTSIEHGYEVSDSTLRFMARRGVALVPTDIDSASFAWLREKTGEGPTDAQVHEFLERVHRDRLRRAIAAGVTIAAGSDNYIDMKRPQGESARRVLFAYRDAGMRPAAVLQAATLNAAKVIGDTRLGVIKPGAYADLIAIDGDPERDFAAIERVRFVMKEGTVHVGEGAERR